MCVRDRVYGVKYVESKQMSLPYEGDIFPRHLFEITNGGGLSCKAVVGIIVCHNSGGAQSAQFVLRAL